MMLSTGAVAAVLDEGFSRTFGYVPQYDLYLYTGEPPASPDDSATGTLLATLDCSNACYVDIESDRVLTYLGNWEGNVEVAGEVGWFRIKHNSFDTDVVSSIEVRIDGTVSDGIADIVLPTKSLSLSDNLYVNDIKIAADSSVVRASGIGALA